MLRDVKTRWNSTFSMLDFAMLYRKPLDLLSGERGNELRQFELKEEEWRLVAQLRDALKVCMRHTVTSLLSDFPTAPDLSRCGHFLLKSDAEPRHCNPGYGPHRQGPNFTKSRLYL
jgi:hypothetical protein